jgi:(S)-ureidoglycine aminohydrolase
MNNHSSKIISFFVLVSLNLLGQNPLKSGVYSFSDTKKEKKETGFRRSILDGQTVDFKKFELHYTTVKPRLKSHNPHKHITEELIIVKEGEITLTIEGKMHKMIANDVAIIKPGETHGIVNESNKKATYLVMVFEANYEVPKSDTDSSFVIHWNDLAYKTHDLGGRRNVFDKKTCQSKRFEMHVTTLNTGNQSHAPHTHRAAEILIPIEGKTEEFIENQWVKSSVGDIIFLESKVPHALKNVGKGQCTYFAFQFE